GDGPSAHRAAPLPPCADQAGDADPDRRLDPARQAGGRHGHRLRGRDRRRDRARRSWRRGAWRGRGRAAPGRRAHRRPAGRRGRCLMDIDMTALRLVEHERDISLDTLVSAIEQALLSAYHRTPGAYEHARVEVDRRSGHVTVWAREPEPGSDEPPAAQEGVEVTAVPPAALGPEFEHTPEGFGRVATSTA